MSSAPVGMEYVPLTVTASVLTTLVTWIALTAYMAGKSKSLAGGLIGAGAVQLLLAIPLFVLSVIQSLPPIKYVEITVSGALVWIKAGLAYSGWTSLLVGILSLIAGAAIHIMTDKYETAAKLLKYE